MYIHVAVVYKFHLTHPLDEVQALSIVHPVDVSPVNAFPAASSKELAIELNKHKCSHRKHDMIIILG